jgi:hypothetical protein
MTHQANMETLQISDKKPGWSFYLGWIVLTALSIPLAFALGAIVLKTITGIVGDYVYVNGVRHITEDYLFMYVFVPLVSLLTGALQYGLLRRYLSRMGGWVFATVAGWFLGAFLIALLAQLGSTDTLSSLDLILLVMGLAIGTAQWLFLRRRWAGAGCWVGATVVGWGLLALLIPGNSLDQYGLITLGLVPACVTAAMLALYLNRVPSAKLGS